MQIIFGLSLLFLAIGIIILLVYLRQREEFGSLNGERVYQDTSESPGEILYATSLPLCGKPDYIIKQGENAIPVEVKTGKTPQREPYQSHIMQLMAYCYLLEKTSGKRPLGGVIKYPEKEFKVAYTDDAEKAVERVVKEITTAREQNIEFHCKHPQHNQKG